MILSAVSGSERRSALGFLHRLQVDCGEGCCSGGSSLGAGAGAIDADAGGGGATTSTGTSSLRLRFRSERLIVVLGSGLSKRSVEVFLLPRTSELLGSPFDSFKASSHSSSTTIGSTLEFVTASTSSSSS
uniref:(northern house mosquito) hypothetical protein n=1 Tax=Culex pipiens TaxID=7175 RepID=A0A8D8GJS1_CULPI